MSRTAAKRLAPMEDVFTHHPIAQLLGIRLQSITKSRVRAELPVMPQHMNRGGRVAGGVIMTFADLLGARGTVANLPPGARTTTLESKTNFFAAGEAPLLEAVSIPLHIGRTTMVWQTTVRNADGRMVAVVTQTQMVLMPRTEQPTESPAGTPPPARKRVGPSRRPGRASNARTAAGGGARRVNGSRARIERP
jgi:1,4-dihydroxy-2-naphthoyl-CoA hydrolase